MLTDSSIFDCAICENTRNAIINKITSDGIYVQFRDLEDREENLDLIFWRLLFLDSPEDVFDFTE